ncbi:spore gernimation protein [Paenibacillus hemerocallicola]|uniref:Spore gernimation protein n=1 Tax=Paenibacillus hemerocallicola TaxID=1172614 RepID=A0A5C4TFW7_9BACL|nr:spore gernimation protein [Paenibacillus hemerocallicola]
MELGKVSSFQMAMMLYSMPVATGIVILPAITARQAEQDLWLSPIIASLVGYMLIYIAYRLDKLYPNKTVMEYCIEVAGRIPGKALGFVFVFFYLHLSGIVIRQYGEFIVGNFFLKTPMIAITGVTVIACAIAVRCGLEVLGRCSQSFITLLIVLVLIVTVLLLPGMNPENVFPVMERGFVPVLKGAASPMDWFSSYFAALFLFPFLSDKSKGMKWGMISVCAVMLTMVITNLAALLLFGELTADLSYPMMVAVRQISLAGFIEHIEAVVMSIWILGAFVQICMHYYIAVVGTAQWLGMKSYKPLVFPLGFLLLVLSVWIAPDLQVLSGFLGTSFAFYALAIRFMIPLLLFLVALLRKKRGKSRASGSNG